MKRLVICVCVGLLFVLSLAFPLQPVQALSQTLITSTCKQLPCVCVSAVHACMCVCVSTSQSSNRGGQIWGGASTSGLDSCRQNSLEWQLGFAVSHRCQCVCVVPIAQGVFRYNECSQQYVWLLYLGQLRTASRAPITSVSFQLNRLKLVVCLLQKFQLQKVM